MSHSSPKIILCICTYRRPDGLSKLLNALPALDASAGMEVVVSDNDAGKEGVAVCDALPDNYPFKVHALSETQAGISAARNAATNEALKYNPDFIAFLDDDEWPETQWLSELLRVQIQQSADVVGGPTRPVFPAEAPTELLDNPYYGADMGLSDSSQCELEAGGNFLLRADILKPLAPTFFRPEFAHSGGEDLAFFMQLAKNGHSMYWAANAVVHEPVPPARLKADWLKHRVVTIHNSRVRVTQLLEPGLSASIVRCTKTVGLGLVAYALSTAAWLSPAIAEKSQALRWKFEGKLTAHLGRITLRSETY